MKKILLLLSMIILVFNLSIAQDAKESKKKGKEKNTAKEDKNKEKEKQKADKEALKSLKSELKGYLGNLEGYKNIKEQNQANLDSNAAEISRLKATVAAQADMKTQAEACQTELNKVRAENEELKKEKEEVKMDAPIAEETPAASTTTKNTKTKGAKKSTSTEGVVYKIQIGLYKAFNINKYFSDNKEIGYETIDGKNRYVIGTFTDEQVAKSFVSDIRKMGIKDAFVAKYVDGARVN